MTAVPKEIVLLFRLLQISLVLWRRLLHRLGKPQTVPSKVSFQNHTRTCSTIDVQHTHTCNVVRILHVYGMYDER